MASITYWNRLIPQPLGASLEPGLAAELRDPAWMLARQIQLGEFLGADSGSPAFVDIGTRTTVFNPANTPMEPAAESEAISPDVTVRVELGEILNGLIDQMVSSASLAGTAKTNLLKKYPLAASTDPAIVNLLAACAGTVPDGVAIYSDVAKNLAPAFDPATNAGLKPVFAAFAAWVVDVLGDIGTGPPANWSAATLDYSIFVAATLPDGRSATLAAQPDRSNDLEWYSFDVAQATPGVAAAPLVTQSLIPTHVRFRGMPNERFWDFESNKIEFGNIVADVSDAGRLLFLDFMLIHGAGWFIAPLDVPVGSLCQVDSVTVHDVFGGTTSVPRADATLGPVGARSTLFSTTDRTNGGVASFLFAAPTCAAAMQRSEPVEDVRLFRDDAANLAWAVEDVAPDALGNPTPGYERRLAVQPPAPLEILRYQLQTQVPPAWFALLPQAASGLLVDFALEHIAGGSPTPWGRIVPSLTTTGSSGVPEQAVPRAGLRMQRLFCRSRWIDGTTYMWMTRRRLLGSRGSASGLAYDQVIPGDSPSS
jgi:hypothetical protein